MSDLLYLQNKRATLTPGRHWLNFYELLWCLFVCTGVWKHVLYVCMCVPTPHVIKTLWLCCREPECVTATQTTGEERMAAQSLKYWALVHACKQLAFSSYSHDSSLSPRQLQWMRIRSSETQQAPCKNNTIKTNFQFHLHLYVLKTHKCILFAACLLNTMAWRRQQ